MALTHTPNLIRFISVVSVVFCKFSAVFSNQQSTMMKTDAGICASLSVSLLTTSRLFNHFLLYTPIDLRFRLYHQSNQTSHSDQPKIYPTVFSQPSIYIDGWLYAMSMTSVICNVPVLSQNDSTYHHSVFTT